MTGRPQEPWTEHHYWIQFWCGLLVGAGAGLWIGSYFVEGAWALAGVTVFVSVGFALACGRWGDSAWEALMHLLRY